MLSRAALLAAVALATLGTMSCNRIPRDAKHDGMPRIVCLGDSLTRGYEVEDHEAWPTLVQQMIDAAGLRYQVVNEGVVGHRVVDAMSRLPGAVEDGAAVLVIALGVNDVLKQADATDIANDLQDVLDRARELLPNAKILLVGMEAPPILGLGPDYCGAFRRLYAELARKNQTALMPYLLAAAMDGDPALMQPDGIHPTAAGFRAVAEDVFAALRPLL